MSRICKLSYAVRSEDSTVMRARDIFNLHIYWCTRRERTALSLNLVVDIVIARDCIVYDVSVETMLSHLLR